MSQAKVDRYKEEKANRAKIMAREKRQDTLWKVGGIFLALVVAAWVSFSVYQSIRGTDEAETQTAAVSYTVDTTALDHYVEALS